MSESPRNPGIPGSITTAAGTPKVRERLWTKEELLEEYYERIKDIPLGGNLGDLTLESLFYMFETVRKIK